jgi:hypothetical protein
MYMPRFNADVQKPKAKGANTMQTANYREQETHTETGTHCRQHQATD